MPESEFKLHDGKALLEYKEWKEKENQLETLSVKLEDHFRATVRSSSAAHAIASGELVRSR